MLGAAVLPRARLLLALFALLEMLQITRQVCYNLSYYFDADSIAWFESFTALINFEYSFIQPGCGGVPSGFEANFVGTLATTAVGIVPLFLLIPLASAILAQVASLLPVARRAEKTQEVIGGRSRPLRV